MILRRDVLIGAAAMLAAPKPALAGPGRLHEVAIRNLVFEPEHLVVRVGDTIRWTNHDIAPHTATATEFGWDTGELARGDSAGITVTADMETGYFCVFHPHMKGRLDIGG